MGAAQASAGRQQLRTAVNVAMGALTQIVGCSPPRASCDWKEQRAYSTGPLEPPLSSSS